MVTRTAVDTGVLLGIAQGDDASKDACRKLLDIGHALLVPSTVLQECELLCRSKRSTIARLGDTIAESMVTHWGMTPAPGSAPINHGIASQLAKAIETQFELPDGFEENHGLVIADSSLVECSYLLTWNTPLLKLPRTELSLFLDSRDVCPLNIITPYEALSALCPE